MQDGDGRGWVEIALLDGVFDVDVFGLSQSRSVWLGGTRLGTTPPRSNQIQIHATLSPNHGTRRILGLEPPLSLQSNRKYMHLRHEYVRTKVFSMHLFLFLDQIGK